MNEYVVNVLNEAKMSADNCRKRIEYLRLELKMWEERLSGVEMVINKMEEVKDVVNHVSCAMQSL